MDSLPSAIDRDFISQIVCSVLESLNKNSASTGTQQTVSEYPILPTTKPAPIPENPSSAAPRASSSASYRNVLIQPSSPTINLGSGGFHPETDQGQQHATVIRPIKKGEFFSIPISDDLFQVSAKPFLDSLIGRVIYAKGDKPVANLILQRKLEGLWDTSSAIRLLPLGRGYFNLQFASRGQG